MSSPPSSRSNRFAAAAASFVAFAGFTLVMPFLPLYFRELGVTDNRAIAIWSGVSLGITPAMTAVLSPLWGRLADRFGLKIMVERSLVSFVFIMAATAFVTQPWHVFALRTLQGFFAGFGALTVTMAASSAHRDDLASSIGSVQIAQRLGPAVGPVVGGLLAQIFGMRATFLVTAAFYAVAFLLVLFLYKDEPAEAPGGSKPAVASVGFRDVLRLPHFLLLMTAIFLLQYMDRTFGPILPLYVARLGAPLARAAFVAGVVYSIAAATAALGHHQCSRLLAAAPARTVLAGSVLAAGAGMLAIGAAVGLKMVYAGTAIFGVATGIAMTAVYTVAGRVIPARHRGVGFGVLTTASLGGIALGPVLTGIVGGASLRLAFLLNAGAMVVLGWIVAVRMSGGSAGESSDLGRRA
jgi:DHA1 family multidrug resistance protein-like MFS transporter